MHALSSIFPVWKKVLVSIESSTFFANLQYFRAKKEYWIQYLPIVFFHTGLHTQNVQCAWWNMNCLFSVDLMPIDVRNYMFLNKTPTNNFPFANFPLVQLLLIVLSVKITDISNGSPAWVAYSQGRALVGSRAHRVITVLQLTDTLWLTCKLGTAVTESNF